MIYSECVHTPSVCLPQSCSSHTLPDKQWFTSCPHFSIIIGTSVSTDSRSEAPSSSPPHRPPTADPTHANTAAPTTEPDPEMNVMDTVTDGQLASQGNLLSVSSICVLVLVVMLVLR